MKYHSFKYNHGIHSSHAKIEKASMGALMFYFQFKFFKINIYNRITEFENLLPSLIPQKSVITYLFISIKIFFDDPEETELLMYFDLKK